MNAGGDCIKDLELPGIQKISSGKVREMFEVDDRILMVATDRISAFDVILPNAIPEKGKVLTQISAFWFKRLEAIVQHHFLTLDVDAYPQGLVPFKERLRGRSMLVKKCKPLPIECVVRGYLAGSGWKDYQRTGSICGIELPPGLKQSERLPKPIFTPATKAVSGHDENISFQRASEIVGDDLARQVRRLSLEIYSWARDYALDRGVIICDTKFEFGLDGSRLLLIDEALTPDSSRFWPADQYQPGTPQPSFDKQYIRDYLETLDWDKTAPGPELPGNVIQATTRRYREAFKLLTGHELDGKP